MIQNDRVTYQDALDYMQAKSNPEKFKKIDTVFEFQIINLEECYTLDCSANDAKGWIVGSALENNRIAKLTITVTDHYFTELIFGRLNPMSALIAGTLKLNGNILEAFKINDILG